MLFFLLFSIKNHFSLKNQTMLSKEVKQNPMYSYLLLLVVAAIAGHQGWRTLFNNFAIDEIGINGLKMGIIQSVRETPGFLTFLVIYLLLFIREERLSAYGIILMGVGISMTGMLPTFYGIIISVFIMSLGFHYFETTNQSLTLQYFTKRDAPLVMGRLKSVAALANIAVGISVWVLSGYIASKHLFLTIGILVIATGIYALYKHPTNKDIAPQTKKIVLKKKYWLYYVISFFSGARRQIFVVFVVFMLVEKYHYSIKEVAILFLINNIMVYLITPHIARSINKYGEKKMLTAEYSFLIIIFLCYAYVNNRYLAGALYVVDHIFFGFAISINSYLQKIAEPSDVANSISTGFAINHISAVIIPVCGGLLWMWNPQLPFILGAILAVCSLVFVQKLKTDFH